MAAFGKLLLGLALAFGILWLVDHFLIPFHPSQPEWSKNGIFQLDAFAVVIVMASILIAKLWNIGAAIMTPGAKPHNIGPKDLGLIFAAMFASVVVLAAAFAVAREFGEPLPQGRVSSEDQNAPSKHDKAREHQ